MIIKKCIQCGKKFQVKLYRKNIAKYCSKKCYWKSQKGISHSPKTQFKKGFKHSEASKKKISEALIGNKYSFKSGKRYNSQGYILILKHSHPFCNCSGYVLEHRLVAEKYLGRYLTKKEVIHHINKIVDDNRIENLYLFSTDGHHMNYHQKLNNGNIKPITKSNLI